MYLRHKSCHECNDTGIITKLPNQHDDFFHGNFIIILMTGTGTGPPQHIFHQTIDDDDDDCKKKVLLGLVVDKHVCKGRMNRFTT